MVKLWKEVKTRRPVDLSLASTSLVERLNASIRNFTSRFQRQSYRFSKRLTAHVHAQAIFAVYYNFKKTHSGFKGAYRHYTPAMKAGLTDRPWEFEDMLDAIEGYWAARSRKPELHLLAAPTYQPLAAGVTSSSPYFVMYSPLHREAKVHKASCRNCQNGAGRKTSRKGKNQWYPFDSEDAARAFAKSLAPLRNSVCAMCVTGKYAGNSVRQINSHRRAKS